jgi:hypothetical protein
LMDGIVTSEVYLRIAIGPTNRRTEEMRPRHFLPKIHFFLRTERCLKLE